MREVFDEQLRGLLERIMEMGGLAEAMLESAVLAILERDEDRIAHVHELEARVNDLHLAIDDKAVSMTVRHQPVARDVRMIFVASRCASDVERVGDCAVNVAQSAAHFLAAPEFERVEVPQTVSQLADAARSALGDALAAMIGRDVVLAARVLEREPAVDDLRDSVFKDLLYDMITRPMAASSALSLLLVSRNLERVGDHATNIAEDLIYLVRGKDIRHQRHGP